MSDFLHAILVLLSTSSILGIEIVCKKKKKKKNGYYFRSLNVLYIHFSGMCVRCFLQTFEI